MTDRKGDEVTTTALKHLESPPPSRQRFFTALEQNWDCHAKRSLPADLTPRIRTAKGFRADHKQPDKKRLPIGRWSSKLVRALASLSYITAHDKVFAHQQLGKQVKLRNCRREHREHWAREVLTSDVEAAISEVKRLESVGRYKAKNTGTLKEAVELGEWTDAPGLKWRDDDNDGRSDEYGVGMNQASNLEDPAVDEDDDEDGGVSISGAKGESGGLTDFEKRVEEEKAKLMRRARELGYLDD